MIADIIIEPERERAETNTVTEKTQKTQIFFVDLKLKNFNRLSYVYKGGLLD
jgi:hypothetical protein